MSDFLLELRSRGNPGADAGQGVVPIWPGCSPSELSEAGLQASEIASPLTSTPRRLALIARWSAACRRDAVSEEFKGPKHLCAAEQALEGFLRKTGLTQDQLEDRDGTCGCRASQEKPGRADRRCAGRSHPGDHPRLSLAQVDALGRDASDSAPRCRRWVRPLQGIVALLGGEYRWCHAKIDGRVERIARLVGHRFHSIREMLSISNRPLLMPRKA
jgi:glycyl-tRNA synthetase beta chain